MNQSPERWQRPHRFSHAPEVGAAAMEASGVEPRRVHREDTGMHDWMDRAACAAADINPKLFFPPGESKRTSEKAKAICGRCPVQLICLEYALRNATDGTVHDLGIWGGLTTSERRHMKNNSHR